MNSPSGSPSVDETLCPTCRHNIPVGIKVAGQHVTRMQCWHKVVMFPNVAHCKLFECEPGAD